jgi:integrase
VRNAKFFIDSLLSERWEDIAAVSRQRSEGKLATVGQVLDAYEAAAGATLRIKDRTVAGNLSALKGILTLAKPEVHDVRELSAECLAGDGVLRAFVLAARKAGRPDGSIKSQINQARSVVCREVLPVYEGLRLPDVGTFGVDIAWRLEDVGFAPIPDAAIAGMESAVAERLRFARSSDGTELERAEALGIWLVYMLMARLGMRNSEVAAARWGWIEERVDRSRPGETVWVMVIQDRRAEGYEVKNGLAGAVAVPAELRAELERTREAAKPGEYLVRAPHATAREWICYRAINDFLRPWLPGREKVSYELRKWAGSLVALREGIYAAQQFLRHRSVKTTETYYRAFLVEAAGVSTEQVRTFHGLDG